MCCPKRPMTAMCIKHHTQLRYKWKCSHSIDCLTSNIKAISTPRIQRKMREHRLTSNDPNQSFQRSLILFSFSHKPKSANFCWQYGSVRLEIQSNSGLYLPDDTLHKHKIQSVSCHQVYAGGQETRIRARGWGILRMPKYLCCKAE